MTSPFAVLGLDPRTADEAAVKRAYAAAIKITRPDRDPVGFRRVRDAYEDCRAYLQEARYAEEEEDDDDEDEETQAQPPRAASVGPVSESLPEPATLPAPTTLPAPMGWTPLAPPEPPPPSPTALAGTRASEPPPMTATAPPLQRGDALPPLDQARLLVDTWNLDQQGVVHEQIERWTTEPDWPRLVALGEAWGSLVALRHDVGTALVALRLARVLAVARHDVAEPLADQAMRFLGHGRLPAHQTLLLDQDLHLGRAFAQRTENFRQELAVVLLRGDGSWTDPSFPKRLRAVIAALPQDPTVGKLLHQRLPSAYAFKPHITPPERRPPAMSSGDNGGLRFMGVLVILAFLALVKTCASVNSSSHRPAHAWVPPPEARTPPPAPWEPPPRSPSTTTPSVGPGAPAWDRPGTSWGHSATSSSYPGTLGDPRGTTPSSARPSWMTSPTPGQPAQH